MARNPFAVSAVPPMIKWLLIANGLAFLFRLYEPGFVLAHFALWPFGSFRAATGHGIVYVGFQPWQLITYGFLHAGFAHLFFNMFGLWMFGRVVEVCWGSRRFLTFYGVCLVGAGLTQLVTLSLMSSQSVVPTIGASGAIFGILLAFGVMFPNARVMLLIPPIPMTAKWFVLGYGALQLFFGVTQINAGIAHFAHLGGMAFGAVLLFYWWRQGRLLN